MFLSAKRKVTLPSSFTSTLKPGRSLLLCREQRFLFVKERNWKSVDDKELQRPSLVFKCLICLLQ
jgi:hypothetical protein